MKNIKIQSFIRSLPVLFLLPYASLGQGIEITSGGGSIAVTGAATIEINNGNFVNNGTYTKGTETFTMSGITTPRSISGTALSEFNNLAVTNSGGISIADNSKVTVSNSLTVDVTSSLTLNSTSAGTASLIHSTPGVTATVQRYMTGASWSWHFLSSPVAAQTISGNFTPSGTNNDYDFYTWYEPSLVWVNFKNTTISPTWLEANGSTSFLPARGYLVAYEANNPTKVFNGVLNTGTVNYSLTMSGINTYQYFNLVGNPYTSAIDWKSASGWTRSNLAGSDNSYWIWNDADGNYGAYSTSTVGDAGTNGVTRYIPSGQGYFVEAGVAVSLTMDNGIKVHNAQAFLKNGENSPEELRLKLTCDANAYNDEAIITFNNSNPEEGSHKLRSMYDNAPELWSVKNGSNYSINFLGDLNTGKIIPLSIKAGTTGNFTLTADQVESFGSTEVRLEDRAEGTYTKLSYTPAYTFAVTETATITDRFFLHFLDVTSVTDSKLANDFSIYAADGKIKITSLEQLGGKINVTDMVGRSVASGRVEAGGTTFIDMKGHTGVYIVSVLTSKGINNTKIIVQ